MCSLLPTLALERGKARRHDRYMLKQVGLSLKAGLNYGRLEFQGRLEVPQGRLVLLLFHRPEVPQGRLVLLLQTAFHTYGLY